MGLLRRSGRLLTSRGPDYSTERKLIEEVNQEPSDGRRCQVFAVYTQKLDVTAMEGKFAGEGLQSIDEDDDMLSAMARELVERNGIGETADAVWRALSTEHQKRFPTNSHGDDTSSIEIPNLLLDRQSGSASLVGEGMDTAPIVVFGQRPEPLSGKRRRARITVPEQASLFGFN